MDKSQPAEQQKKMKPIIRIGIVALIVLVIAGIFVYKTWSDAERNENLTASEAGNTLPLAVSSIDLETLKTYKLPMLIDFGSDDCQPCREMAPVLEKLHEEWQGKVIVQFADVWKYTTAANGFPISVIPTQMFFNADGTPYVPSEAMQKLMEFTLYDDKTTGEHSLTVHQGGVTEAQMRQLFAEMGVE